MELRRGVFITFEGGEGAGKSTLIDGAARQLAAKGYLVVKTREPGGTQLGEQIRGILLNHSSGFPLTAYTELCLFLAARAQHIEEVIEPALKVGKVVLCDRFNASTIAYQGVARGLGMAQVTQFCNFVCHGIQPQLTLYLDIDPEKGLARARRDQPPIAGARGYDRIESEGLQFHQKIRQAFLDLQRANPQQFKLLDASQTPEVILAESMKLIHSLLH